MRPSTAGKKVCPEIAKTSLIDLSLACSIGKSYGFEGFDVVREVFSSRTRPENAVPVHSAQFDASFRFKTQDNKTERAFLSPKNSDSKAY